MTRTIATAALLAALIPATAQADTLRLDTPMAGATLSENGVDMSVYFTALDRGAFEVVATYVAQGEPGDPTRLVIALNDKDATRFALPGHPGTLYGFARNGETVTVTATPAERKLALAE